MGILDNLTNGAWGNYFGQFGANMNPAIQENQFRQKAYDALSQQNGPQDAAILMGNPQAFGLAFQRQLFMDQLNDISRRNPNMSLSEALFQLSQEGQNQLYGSNPVPGFKTSSGAEAPGMRVGRQIIPPPGMGFGVLPGPAQAQPSQQPAAAQPQPQGSAPLSPMDQAGVNYKGAVAEAEAKGKGAGGLQPGFPAALVKAHQTISALEAIRDDPRLESISGRIAGKLPAQYSSAPDLVNSIDSANNLLLNATLTQARNISGRAINAGTLKEIRPYDLQADRVGGADSLRTDINRAIKTIQDETDAAWVGSNSPAEYKPVWEQPQAAQSSANAPNDRHIQFLRAHPEQADQFDAKFGKGASQKILGNAQRL